MAFDVSKLTLGEIAKVEELSGVAVGLIEDAGTPKGRMFAALAYVMKKRDDPSYTIAKAEALTLDEVTEMLGDNDGGEIDLGKATTAPAQHSIEN